MDFPYFNNDNNIKAASKSWKVNANNLYPILADKPYIVNEHGQILTLDKSRLLALDDIKPDKRHISIIPNEGNSFNFTEKLCRDEWNNLSPEVFKKLCKVRTLTGSRLKNLLLEFNMQVAEVSGGFSLGGCYKVLDYAYFPVTWNSLSLNYFGDDIASLWAFHFNENYASSIERIYSHVFENEANCKPNHESENASWEIEYDPLNLDLPVPWDFFSLLNIQGGNCYNYFRNGVLVACACYIPHENFGKLTTFFTLRKHRRNINLKRWFPLYPPNDRPIFFLDESLDQSDCITLVPDEESVLRRHTINSSGVLMSISLACPGGFSRLLEMNLDILNGKNVEIDLYPDQAKDEKFLTAIETKLSRIGCKSLTKYRVTSESRTCLETTKFDRERGDIGSSSLVKHGTIAKPGEPVPGSNKKRKMQINPIIESGFLIWLYGKEKSGKSWIARNLAHILSYGGKLWGRYQAAGGLRVLYIDSELLPDKLEEAYRKELAGLGYTEGRKFALKAAKASDNPSGEIDLLEGSWQEWLDTQLPNYDVVILDCYYNLIGRNTTPTDLFSYISPWKNKGVSFVVVDHTNNEGELQGSVNKRRAMELGIEVNREKGDDSLILSFPLARYLGEEDTKPISMQMIFEENAFLLKPIESQGESVNSLPDAEHRIALVYVLKENYTVNPIDIGAALGYSPAMVYEWIKKYKEGKMGQAEAIGMQIEAYGKMSLEELLVEAMKYSKPK